MLRGEAEVLCGGVGVLRGGAGDCVAAGGAARGTMPAPPEFEFERGTGRSVPRLSGTKRGGLRGTTGRS